MQQLTVTTNGKIKQFSFTYKYAHYAVTLNGVTQRGVKIKAFYGRGASFNIQPLTHTQFLNYVTTYAQSYNTTKVLLQRITNMYTQAINYYNTLKA